MELTSAMTFSKSSRFLPFAALPILAVLSGCGSAYDLLISPSVSVGTHAMSFTAVAGGAAPASQSTTASCTKSGSSIASLVDGDRCDADVTSDKDWLKVTPSSVFGQENITISVVTTGLAAGTYTGNIHVEYVLVAIDGSEDIAITLTVTAP